MAEKLKITQMLVPKSRYGRKCPYLMKAESITIHNTSNDAPAKNEVSYMIGNSSQTSFHYAVDDKQAVQGILTTRNAWHAGDGNGRGNRRSISIEICYSKSGGTRFNKAERNAAYLTALLLKQKGWGISRVKRHKDWSGKNCPHRTISKGWKRFLNIVQKELDELRGKKTGKPEAPTVTLKRGSRGEQVRKLQKCLNRISKAGLVEDGSFGPATDRAVRAFQKKYGLAVDGSVGPKTRAELNRLL